MMKPIYLLGLICLSTLWGCEKEMPDSANGLQGDGFYLRSGGKNIVSPSDIDYYDLSTHLIYLKQPNDFLQNASNEYFTVYANGQEIYSGYTVPSYSSYLPSGPVIFCQPSFYDDYIISISYVNAVTSNIADNGDPRSDPRILEALGIFDQDHEGLTCEIESLRIQQGKVFLELSLQNPDSYDYYYLDPDKTGLELFHYFTNGLILNDRNSDSDIRTYSHVLSINTPEPFNKWDMTWFSLIRSQESKTISIVYEYFEVVPEGSYLATFTFPGMHSQISYTELTQEEGRIWLGSLKLQKEISVN